MTTRDVYQVHIERKQQPMMMSFLSSQSLSAGSSWNKHLITHISQEQQVDRYVRTGPPVASVFKMVVKSVLM